MTTLARMSALLVIAAVLAGCSQMGTSTGEPNKLAHAIAGRDADGKFMQLSDFRGQVVLLDFWFTKCGYCRIFEKDEKVLHKQYEGRPFVILGVNTDPSRQELLETQAEAKLPWRSWFDGPQGPITSQWRVDGFPTVYLIDHEGRIRANWRGKPHSIAEVQEKLELLVQEAEKASRAGEK
jgi:cytochrome oxidase Cu insertion factor (SCO1/SenC/PrrC family)